MANLDSLLRVQRLTTARRLVYRHPDLSLEILQTASGDRAENPTIRFIAQARDQQCGVGSADRGWDAMLADRLAHADRYTAYDQARSRLFEEFKLGNGQKACDLPLVKLASSTPSPLLTVDAAMLSGTALLFANRPTEAAASFKQAFELAQQNDVQLAAHAMLLWGNALRLAGDSAGAAQNWRNATTAAADCLARQIPTFDPVFWERASYLRPAQESWPDAVQQQLQTTSSLNYGGNGQGIVVAVGAAQSETPMFACLGQCRFARNEPQAALLAFKRAETSATDPAVQSQLRLEEAKCLSRLQQEGAATAILMGMVNSKDPAMMQPALALLGSIKLQSGQTEFGQRLLQRAIEQNQPFEWPQRGEAEADLGLAYLMQNDEASGMRWLRSAQKRFEAAGQHELLAKSLWNEAQYLEHKGKNKAEVDAITDRLRTLEVAAAPGAELNKAR
jgi:tetratricopeptide (TPR) repeat protein